MRVVLGLLASVMLSGCCGSGCLTALAGSSPPGSPSATPQFEEHVGSGPRVWAGRVRSGLSSVKSYTLDIQAAGASTYHRRIEIHDPDGRFKLTDLPEN